MAAVVQLCPYVSQISETLLIQMCLSFRQVIMVSSSAYFIKQRTFSGFLTKFLVDSTRISVNSIMQF